MDMRFDIVVVGGGHAGIEAALAGARLGCRTALATHALDEIGRMPCNPAIGGLGKGHLVREIDVLGGEMGLAIDATGIQFRILNRRKGPAVQAPRAQADKHRYQERMRDVVMGQPGLTVVEGDVVDLQTVVDGAQRRVAGTVLADGRVLFAPRVVLSTGTFMRGLMHVGGNRTRGGREGAASSEGLSGNLTRLGLRLVRLKTGTPPRLRAGSIEYDRLEEQPGDSEPRPFSFRTRHFAPRQVLCHLAHTNTCTHDVIRANLHRSPLYGGIIEGLGPRYCPSIEDKVVRFGERERHLLFLEPEGLDTDEVYVNGLSTSLPADVQEAVVHSIEGLERAVLSRNGYAVEYDSVPSYQADRTLQCKSLPGLWLAGQILGTSGYEEAAAQGLVAGVNAARSLAQQEPFVPVRSEAYIGVLIDDLVTKEILEPYRMFTSRAEHRLRLRCDNAASRLADAARELGLLPAADLAALEWRRQAVDRAIALLQSRLVETGERRLPAAEWLRRPEARLQDIGALPGGGREVAEELDAALVRDHEKSNHKILEQEARAEVENQIKYSGYIDKLDNELRRQSHLDDLECPPALDYLSIGALSREAREKLDRFRPETVGQASRIDGVRRGDLAVLTVHVRRWREREAG
ncbi:MAG: tRNA uridine-5-carboxymethylaminomethyl(34) synthesis enzyme MnmG [Candidatus Krumholzibacteriia bacterium]